MNSKTTLTLATIILTLAALVHFLRLLTQWELIIGSYSIPNWISIIGTILPALVAFYLNKMRQKL